MKRGFNADVDHTEVPSLPTHEVPPENVLLRCRWCGYDTPRGLLGMQGGLCGGCYSHYCAGGNMRLWASVPPARMF